mmetsp:Transcript_30159/g.29467  ORF Transcript_30159/g.29467 Transcript_30159/m.29467 type:complete len:121 (+) Transcript_30159:394-756(+)
MNYQQSSPQATFEQQIEKNFNIDYQSLKTKIQKIKYSLKSQLAKKPKDDEDEMDVGDERKKDHPKLENNILEFYNLWFRYIISYNTSFVLKSSYQETSIQNLVNIRPSIVSSRKIEDIVV